MSRIDFYILQESKPQARYPFACRLINKAYQRGHKLYIHTEAKEEAHRLDDLLWTFQDTSFIPHNLSGEGPTPPPPVQIGFDNKATGFNDVLINMATEVPPFFNRFKRIIEIVIQEPDWKKRAREHFLFYRENGCELNTHNI